MTNVTGKSWNNGTQQCVHFAPNSKFKARVHQAGSRMAATPIPQLRFSRLNIKEAEQGPLGPQCPPNPPGTWAKFCPRVL